MRRPIANTWIVFLKEWRDALRDRRSLISALVFPLAMPLLLGVMLATFVEEGAWRSVERVGVAGAANAPELVAYLRNRGLQLERAGESLRSAEDAVRDQAVPVALVIPDEYARQFERGVPAKVHLVFDSASRSFGALTALQRNLVEYSSETGGLRLLARGVDPRLAAPVAVEQTDVATASDRASSFLLMVPFFLVLATFIGGMHVAIDVTAGERERGSLEPLLVNPVPRLSIVGGKWLVAAAFALGTGALTAICCLIVLRFSPLAEIGLRFRITNATLVGVTLGVVPLALLSSALQVLVASFARSFREAQTYVAILLLLPLIPGMWLTLYPPEFYGWEYAIPILSQIQILNGAFGGERLMPSQIALATVVSFMFTVIAVVGTARLFCRERIIIQG